ncbi:MAG: segregation/condensation protein A [Eubacterium sp.]|nr:segregation/condensation protein A [Eubacterium sp.]
MENLTYKLEVFEGPMDLLLHLISKHKLNINDIPIVELVNQYLDYVRQMEEADFDIAGDFLEMAARLIYIKTVSLLPRHEEAEKLKKELTGELIEYRDCKLMAEKLSNQTDGFGRFVREPQKGYVNYDYERFHEGEELLNAYINVAGKAMRRLPPPIDTFKVIVAKRFVNVATKVRTVMRKLWSGKKVSFLKLFDGAQSKSELVATFLAVLELAKTKRITIDGDIKNPDVQMVNEVNEAEIFDEVNISE